MPPSIKVNAAFQLHLNCAINAEWPGHRVTSF